MTFLIVLKDGEETARLQETIENHGHGCLTARDVDEASLTAQLARLDAVALDLDGDTNGAIEWMTGLSLADNRLAARFVLLARPPVPEHVRMQASVCRARVLERPVSDERLLAALEERGRRRPATAPDPERGRGGPAPSGPTGEADREH